MKVRWCHSLCFVPNRGRLDPRDPKENLVSPADLWVPWTRQHQDINIVQIVFTMQHFWTFWLVVSVRRDVQAWSDRKEREETLQPWWWCKTSNHKFWFWFWFLSPSFTVYLFLAYIFVFLGTPRPAGASGPSRNVRLPERSEHTHVDQQFRWDSGAVFDLVWPSSPCRPCSPSLPGRTARCPWVCVSATTTPMKLVMHKLMIYLLNVICHPPHFRIF